jgi:hypothetical protein
VIDRDRQVAPSSFVAGFIQSKEAAKAAEKQRVGMRGPLNPVGCGLWAVGSGGCPH